MSTAISVADALHFIDGREVASRSGRTFPSVDPATGTYQVKFANFLPDGLYTVRVRAEDAGFVSDPSPKYTFEVVTPKAK